MKSRAYWKKRFEALEAAQNKKGLDFFHNLSEQYRLAAIEIEKEIAKWYARYASENEITLTEAQRRLTSRELAEFRMTVKEYIEKGKTLNVSSEWAKELEAASIKFHVSRLEALRIQMQQQVELIYGSETDGLDKLARTIYTDGYYHSAFEIQRGIGIGWDMARLDTNKINKLLAKPWAADGKNFSSRIWTNKNKLLHELETTFTQNIIRGVSPIKTIKSISERLEVGRNRAGALVMTESSFFASSSQRDAFRDLDVERFEIVATLDTRTSETCRDLDGKVFPMKDFKPGITAPPFHVRCRTTTVPFFDDEFTENEVRAARDADGKYSTVPASMTYREWMKRHVEEASEDS